MASPLTILGLYLNFSAAARAALLKIVIVALFHHYAGLESVPEGVMKRGCVS